MTHGTWRTDGVTRDCICSTDDIPEAYALEFLRELVDITKGVDDPAFTELAEDVLLRATQFAAAEKAVGDNDAASGRKETMCFPNQRGFVRAMGIATTLNRVDSVDGCGRLRCVFVVAESQRDTPAFWTGFVEKTALLKLQGDEGDPIQVGPGKAASETAQRRTETATMG